MNVENTDRLKNFLLAHYEKREVDYSLYDYFYFNDLYLSEKECFRLYIDNPNYFKIEDHIKIHQKWNKSIEGGVSYIMREQAQQRIYNEDRVIMVRAIVKGVDLGKISKVLYKQGILSDKEFSLFSKESIIIALDTPKYLNHSIHSVEELIDMESKLSQSSS